jgi:hypothetical protein
MSDQLPVLLGLAGAAYLLGRAAMSGMERRDGIDALAWGLVLLPLLLSSTLFVSLWLGASTPGPLLSVVVVALAANLLARLGRRRAAHAAQNVSDPGTTRHSQLDTLDKAFFVIPAAALALAWWSAGDWHDDIPGGSWDSMAIWNNQARVLVRGSGDWPALFRDRVIGHPDYPLMLPGTLACVWSWLGREAAAAPRSVALLLLSGVGLMVFSALRSLCGHRSACLATGLVLSTPLLAELARYQLADPALALMLLASSAALASRFAAQPSLRQPAWLAGLALGAMPWCKNEGLVLAAVVGGAFVVCRLLGRASRPTPQGEWTGLLAGAALPLFVLAAFKLSWAPDDPMFDDVGATLARHLPDPERWSAVLGGFAAQFNPWADGSIWGLETSRERWGLAWPAIGLLSLLGLWRGRAWVPDQRLFLGLVALGSLAAYLLVYVTTSAQSQTWHIETSLFRLLLQLFPTVLLWACALALPATDHETDSC